MKNTLMILGLVGLMSTSAVMAESTSITANVNSEDYGSISSFCRDRLMTLKRAYHLAEIESQQGNISTSVQILENSLVEAAAKIQPRFGNALTSKAIKRGVSLLASLKRTPDSKQKLRTINHFLFNYFLFIEDVSNRLDVPFYSVNERRHNSSNVLLEKLFINFAQEQVNMVLKTMSMTAREGRSEVIYPIGSPTLLLTALRQTTAAMANDLSESIFAARYACQIQELDIVSNEIGDYLATRSTYADEFIATQELVGSVKNALRNSRDCSIGGGNGGSYEPSETRTTDALYRSFTLQAGTTEQVRLNGGKYIKKLIISAEGLRSDAMFDVVVNGDVKGTVYVPGRDPSYFVTVEDFADSIEFVSRNGTAIISKILVVAE